MPDSELSRFSEAYGQLVDSIGATLKEARTNLSQTVNSAMLDTYWQIGQQIVDFEQKGKTRAAYGENLLPRLSRDLTLRFGKGFNRSNLIYMRKLYLAYPKRGTLSHKLSWSHYYEILKLADPLEISFYAKETEIEHWSVRELKRQMKSMLFHRLALSKDQEGVLRLARNGVEIQQPEDIVRDPLVLEFAGIQPRDMFLEKDIEDALMRNLETFLLELGKGFAFVARQYRMQIGTRPFYCDLVFYHRILKCFVLIDLKRGEITHEDICQMNLYLNYFKSEENEPDDNEPIGIVLGALKDKVLMEYALQGISNQLFVSRYLLYLPDRAQFQQELNKLLNESERKSPVL